MKEVKTATLTLSYQIQYGFFSLKINLDETTASFLFRVKQGKFRTVDMSECHNICQSLFVFFCKEIR